MKRIIAFFKSIPLAVALIVVLVVFSILATFVPQGRDQAFYFSRYPSPLAFLIVYGGFKAYFTSALFFVPAGLLFVSCAVCLVDGLARKLKRAAPRRFGPDLIHLGVLVLLVGGAVSGLGRQEEAFYLGEGDRVNVAGEAVLTLESFTTRAYPDGRPADWVSTVRVERNGRSEPAAREIRVNGPLALGAITVYQYSTGREERALVRRADGASQWLAAGDTANSFPETFLVKTVTIPSPAGAPTDGTIVLEKGNAAGKESSGAKPEELSLKAGDRFGGYTVRSFASRPLTGLLAVRDPGVVPVAVALALMAAGLCLTYAQKLLGRKP